MFYLRRRLRVGLGLQQTAKNCLRSLWCEKKQHFSRFPKSHLLGRGPPIYLALMHFRTCISKLCALQTAFLSSGCLWYWFREARPRLQDNGVTRVFGMQEGFWSWLSGVTDNSLYPVMFMSYLDAMVPGLDVGWRRTVFLFIVSIALAYLNYRYTDYLLLAFFLPILSAKIMDWMRYAILCKRLVASGNTVLQSQSYAVMNDWFILAFQNIASHASKILDRSSQSVLLQGSVHRWQSGSIYDPFHHSSLHYHGLRSYSKDSAIQLGSLWR